jgi:glutamyl-tRNA synthetase
MEQAERAQLLEHQSGARTRVTKGPTYYIAGYIAGVTPSAGAGRFAPSPSADLHIGNLRTAILAWFFARSTGRRFLMRVDDLDDRTHTDIAQRQLDDLAAIGLTWDEPPEWQSEHPQRYDAVVDDLAGRGLLYECYCSRRDVAQAPRAPHAPQGAYPGTCRDLTDAERETRRAETGRPPALRLRTDAIVHTVHDLLHGEYTGIVDDFVIRRGDGVAAYNLAVVVDDATQGIDQVVRGDDLLSSSPRQAYLARLLGYPEPTYAHVALVLNEDGARLAKRDGAVTLAEIGPQRAVAQIAESLGWPSSNLDELLAQFDPAALPRRPWIYRPTG